MLRLLLVFEIGKGTNTLILTLASKFRNDDEAASKLSQNYVRLDIRPELGISTCEPSRSNAWHRNKANLLNFDYAARAKLFSPINSCVTRIYELNHKARHAYRSTTLAVKTGQPQNV